MEISTCHNSVREVGEKAGWFIADFSCSINHHLTGRLNPMCLARSKPGVTPTEVVGRGRDILTLIFLSTTIASAGVGGIYTYHYTQFFPAINQLQLDISSFSFNPTSSSLNATVVFTITNPSSYSGIRITDFITDLTIQAPGNITIPQGIVPFYVRPTTLDPQNRVMLRIPFTGSLNGPYRVYQLLSMYTTSQFRFNFTSTVFLSTFLYVHAGVLAVYECTTTTIAGSCAQAGVLVKITPGP